MGFLRKLGKQGEKASENGVLPTPICQLFQVHGSQFKPDPSCDGGQASVVCIPHRVFLLRVRKNPFNRLLALRIKLFRTLRFPYLLHQIQILLPDMCGVYLLPFSFAPHFALQGQLLHCAGVLRYVRLPSRSVVVCLNSPPQGQV